ncbi:MAG: cysteine desulfurase, partial [Clostridiales bacterium]|nr:cysteine desulfurase [Clostridiales bacterium]
ANNLAILGTAYDKKRRGKHCITSSIEHPSVLQAFSHLESQGYEITYLPVDEDGIISLDDLKSALREDTILVSIMHVNNEIGSIQEIQEIGLLLRKEKSKPVFHVDAIQSFGKLPIRPEQWGIDLLSISGHKIHAPKGIGALYIKKGVRLQPILFGGSQQGGIRSGTENISGIVGLGEAAKWIAERQTSEPEHLSHLKGSLAKGIQHAFPRAHINGSLDKTAPHILNVAFPSLRGEILLHGLEEEGVYISTGSACSSRNKKLSHVLTGIGLNDQMVEGSIRISLSHLTTREDIDEFIPILIRTVERLERYIRR